MAYGIRLLVSRRCTKSPTDGCMWGRRTERLRLQDLAELRIRDRCIERRRASASSVT